MRGKSFKLYKKLQSCKDPHGACRGRSPHAAEDMVIPSANGARPVIGVVYICADGIADLKISDNISGIIYNLDTIVYTTLPCSHQFIR